MEHDRGGSGATGIHNERSKGALVLVVPVGSLRQDSELITRIAVCSPRELGCENVRVAQAKSDWSSAEQNELSRDPLRAPPPGDAILDEDVHAFPIAHMLPRLHFQTLLLPRGQKDHPFLGTKGGCCAAGPAAAAPAPSEACAECAK